MAYIDVHCHLNNSDYGDLDVLIEALRQADVAKVITSGTDLESSREALILAEKYETVYFSVGFHPTELSEYSDGALVELKKLLSHPKCVAIGEIGLDYHYPDTDRESQKKAFESQLELASECHMPVVIHSRDSCQDTYNILREHRANLESDCLLHCFSYSPEMALEFQKLGVKFSFGGMCTYHGSKKARRSIAALDVESLLTETDSPYNSPVSRQGVFPNTPLSIPDICGSIATLRNPEEAECMADIVWRNAHELFPKLK